MNIDLDKYTRNFRIFYTKLIGNHPEKEVLQKKFKILLENQGNKWRSGLFNKGTTEIKSAKTFLEQAKNTSASDRKTNKIKHEWMTQTSNFQRAFVFCCIYSFIEAKSKQGLMALKQNLEKDQVFVEGRVLPQNLIKKTLIGWVKLQKLFFNVFSMKPYVAVADIVNEFCEQFIQAIYKKVTGGYIDKIQFGEINQSKLNQLAAMTKTNINYFELEKHQIKSIKKFGNHKISVNIGYQRDQKNYVVAKQLPSKKKQDIEQQKTLKKFAAISQQISKMYEQTNNKLSNFESIILSKQNIYKAVAPDIKIQVKTSRLRRSNSLQSSRF